MDEHELKDLIDKYLAETATPGEEKKLLEWYHELDNSEAPILFSSEKEKNLLFSRVRKKLEMHIDKDTIPLRPIRKMIYRPVAVASALLLFAVGGYLIHINYRQHIDTSLHTTAKHDVVPGGNKAVLTLADGSIVVLSDVKNGQIAQQGNVLVKKTADGQLVYTTGYTDKTQNVYPTVMNTITTPKGGKYHLLLSDGTQVWLNAASSISYPVVFTGKNREVSVTGEAYFEVVHNSEAPFVVNARGISVKDLGTQFNINAYDDEPTIKTTLVDGSVKLSTIHSLLSTVLISGEQAVVNKQGSIHKETGVDIEHTIAWKNNLFIFSGDDIQTIMRQLNRWYQVEVEYQGNMSNRHFSGIISRSNNLSAILKMLETTEKVRFRVEENKIMVSFQ
jgi:ferric-dicitrate binding protein FerR (iron transport regulator)